MSELDAYVRKMLAHAHARFGGRIDATTEEHLLNYAFDELGFEGDELDLLDAIRAATAPRKPTQPPRRGAPGQRPSPAKRPRVAFDPELVSAPFRFVTLPDTIVPAEPEAAKASLDVPLPTGFCGWIEVEWRFETPMLIGQGVEVTGPTRLAGRPVIPGATLRGLLRAAVETVSHGRLGQGNGHHRYGVRDFEHPLFADEGRPLWENIGSAWLRPARPEDPAKGDGDSDFVLEPCGKRTIRIRDLPHDLNGGRPTGNGAWHTAWLGKELEERYAAAGMKTEKQVDFTRARAFADAPESSDVRPGGAAFEGVLVFAGRSPTLRNITPQELDEQDANPRPGNQKKREYVFSAKPIAPPVRLRTKVWERFRLMNSKPGHNKRVPTGSWEVLEPTLRAGSRIPVFVNGMLDRQEDPAFDIGLTRLFKRAHRHSVDDLLKGVRHRPFAGSDPDIAEALFGHVFEEADWNDRESGTGAARKGRVAFGFAWLQEETPAHTSREIETVMMAPRASFAPFYLAGRVKDWSEPGTPAGRKRYLPRFQDGPGESAKTIYDTLRSWRGNDNAELRSTLVYLEPEGSDGELAFRGDVSVHNVTAVEIGALLWAITHGADPSKPFRHMIGRGRSAGAGQARVARVTLRLRANREEGAALLVAPESWELPAHGREGWTSADAQSLGPFLRAFHDHMRAHAPDWPNSLTVREHLGAASPALCKELARDYMPLKAHQALKNAVKAAPNRSPPTAPDRLLPAPAVGHVVCSYSHG